MLAAFALRTVRAPVSRWYIVCCRGIQAPGHSHGRARYFCATTGLENSATLKNIRKIERAPQQYPYSIRPHTLIVKNPTAITPEAVLSAIEPISVEPFPGEAPVIVLLATPSFAGWLAPNGSFLQGFLEKFVHKTFFPSSSSLPFRVVVGVVDRLTRPPLKKRPQSHNETHFGHNGEEGFVYMITSPQSLDIIEAPIENAVTTRYPSTIQRTVGFRFDYISKRSVRPTQKAPTLTYDFSSPLSNTIFQNGQEQTLYAISCERANDSTSLKLNQVVELLSITIKTQWSPARVGSSESTHSMLSVPLLALTAPRKVVSSMGNIVSRISLPGGSLEGEPASKELEASVQRYFSQTGTAPYAMPVWALVLPTSLYDQLKQKRVHLNTQKRPAKNKEDEQATIENSWMIDPVSRQYRMLAQFRQGATLHRVLSGGGGWGKKAGLLSLDPETTFLVNGGSGFEGDPQTSFDPFNERSELPQAASPGSYVQFLASTESSTGESTEKLNSDISHRLLSMNFGVIPSSIDTLPSSNSSDSSVNGKIESEILSFTDHLGLLSESGMALHIGEHDKRGIEQGTYCQTKIDVPFSLITLLHVAEEKDEPSVSSRSHLEPRSVHRDVAESRNTVSSASANTRSDSNKSSLYSGRDGASRTLQNEDPGQNSRIPHHKASRTGPFNRRHHGKVTIGRVYQGVDAVAYRIWRHCRKIAETTGVPLSVLHSPEKGVAKYNLQPHLQPIAAALSRTVHSARGLASAEVPLAVRRVKSALRIRKYNLYRLTKFAKDRTVRQIAGADNEEEVESRISSLWNQVEGRRRAAAKDHAMSMAAKGITRADKKKIRSRNEAAEVAQSIASVLRGL